MSEALLVFTSATGKHVSIISSTDTKCEGKFYKMFNDIANDNGVSINALNKMGKLLLKRHPKPFGSIATNVAAVNNGNRTRLDQVQQLTDYVLERTLTLLLMLLGVTL